MTIHDFDYFTDDPELILRPYIPDDDASWFDGSSPPSLVLELHAHDREPARWALAVDQLAVDTFHRTTVQLIGSRDFKHNRFSSRGPEERSAALRDLANQSHAFLRSALGTAGLARFVKTLSLLPDGSVLRVASEGLPGPGLPWGLLHPGVVQGLPVEVETGFLGHRFLVAAPLWNRYLNLRAGAERKRYGFVDDPNLRSVRQGVERVSIASHMGGGFDPLHRLEHDYAQREEDLGEYGHVSLNSVEELADYLVATPRKGIHFACHGGVSTTSQNSYQFAVRNGRTVDARLLHEAVKSKSAMNLASSPKANASFVFFNMCVSVGAEWVADPWRALGMEGAKALVGTIGDVCDFSAAAVARNFYNRALGEGQPVGLAFLETVRAAMRDTLNPTNLLFVFMGDPRMVLK